MKVQVYKCSVCGKTIKGEPPVKLVAPTTRNYCTLECSLEDNQ